MCQNYNGLIWGDTLEFGKNVHSGVHFQMCCGELERGNPNLGTGVPA